MADTDLVIVQSFSTLSEAEMAKGALESAEIDAMIQGDSVGGMRPHMAGSSGGFKLLVRAEDQPAAQQVLEPSEERT
jgi:hypothetical protein